MTDLLTTNKEMDLIKVKTNKSGERVVSGRRLYEFLQIKTPYTQWFDRMLKYGFEDGVDYFPVSQKSESGGASGVKIIQDHIITLDMAKELCMIQRSEKGSQYRQYFLDLEKAWNTPEQVMARALKVAGQTIDKLKGENAGLLEDVQRMKPKEIFADAVATSHTSILIGDLAKLIKQNGVDIGQKRLFAWMRDNGYLIKRNGSDWNMPTQKSMERGLFEVRESTVNNPDGSVRINKTTKVTGKGQQYFVNRFLSGAR